MNGEEMRDALMATLVSFGIDYAQEASDALLSTVRKIAAAELRAAADRCADRGAQQILRARADELDPE